ncbi:hypothetical protein [Enterococcus sp. DIV1283b]|uniref:hypothetical protein n=1 Tax=Enterococcus sp. DIV1283b TaxID=2774745 RepID=UPI003846D04A
MEKYIEKNFIEVPIYRKQKIFEYLISKKSSNIKHICEIINISIPTLYKEIDQINQLSQDLVKIQSGIVYLNLINEKQAEYFLNKLYKQSDFLSLLSFYLFNTTRKKTLELPISRSKFYYVKSKVTQFLKINDLEIKDQLVIGSRLKINWIKSIISIKYGFYPLQKSDFIYCHADRFIQKINNIESCYLTERESKIFLYHLNLILRNPNEVILTSKEEKLFASIISPPFLENDLKNLFNIINCQNKKSLLNYAKLCYFLLSTHAFSPKIMPNYKNKIVKLLFDYPEISELIHTLENKLNINIKENEIAFNILYNHLKLCVINWQLPLNFELTSNLDDNKNQFIEIFHDWNRKNDLKLILPTPILNNLFEKLIKLKSLDDSPKLFIYTDSWIKYTETSDSLKNKLAVRIPLIDYWISSKEELLNRVRPEDIIISDDYFFSYSNNHQNNFYLPALSESELNNISKQIVDCLYNFSIAN